MHQALGCVARHDRFSVPPPSHQRFVRIHKQLARMFILLSVTRDAVLLDNGQDILRVENLPLCLLLRTLPGLTMYQRKQRNCAQSDDCQPQPVPSFHRSIVSCLLRPG